MLIKSKRSFNYWFLRSFLASLPEGGGTALAVEGENLAKCAPSVIFLRKCHPPSSRRSLQGCFARLQIFIREEGKYFSHRQNLPRRIYRHTGKINFGKQKLPTGLISCREFVLKYNADQPAAALIYYSSERFRKLCSCVVRHM